MAGRPKDKIAPKFAKDSLSMTTLELAKKYGIAESTVSDWRLYCKRHLDLEVGYGRPKFVFKNRKLIPDTKDDSRFWELMSEMSHLRDEERAAQAHLSVGVEEELPVAIALTGDWHIGMEGVLYEEMDSDLTAIAGMPGVMVVGLGDYAHNPKARMRPGSSLFRMVVPDPDEQYRMAMYQAKKLAGQWIGMVKGCHDDWDSTLAGFERVSQMCELLDTAYLGHGALITISVGQETYKILARHKYKYESSINITNTQRRAWELIGQPDAVVFGHLHHTVSHKEPRGDRDVIYMRSGSYFHWDEFGMKIGHHQGQRGIPLLILYPNEHKMVPFYGADFENGLRFLEAERKYYREAL